VAAEDNEKVFRQKIACSLVLKRQCIPTRQSRDRSANINRDSSHLLRVIREKNDDWLKRSYRFTSEKKYIILRGIYVDTLFKQIVRKFHVNLPARSRIQAANLMIHVAAVVLGEEEGETRL
jgi:hypothetical protein